MSDRLPTTMFVQGDSVDPDTARAIIESRPIPTNVYNPNASQIKGFSSSIATGTVPAPASIEELARGLKANLNAASDAGEITDRIYEYCANQIDFLPTYGLQKGALGALLDQQANSFDISDLMVQLCTAAGLSAQYVFGTLALTAAELNSWLGTHTTDLFAARNLMGNSMIPAVINGTKLEFSHVWVRVSIGGTWYHFDPSIKSYTTKSGINLGTAMGYNASTFLSNARSGATLNSNYVQNLNRANIRSNLSTMTDNLVSYIRTNNHAAGVDDIVGGKSIVPATLGIRQISHPKLKSGTTPTAWTGVPDTYKHRLKVVYDSPNIDLYFWSADIHGKRLTITFNTSHQAELRLDGAVQATSSAQTPGSWNSVQLTVVHPYADTSRDQSVWMRVYEGEFYLIASAWGNAGPRMSELHNKKLYNFVGSGSSMTSEEVLGEQYATMFYSHSAQVSRSLDLINRMTNCVTPFHHMIGLCGELGGAPFIDMSMVIASSSALDNNYDQVKWNDTVGAMHGVTLEASGIQENTGPVGVSATTVIDMSTQAGDKIYDGKTANWTGTVKPALQAGGYAAQTLTDIENFYINNGFRVAIPEDGTQSLGLWNGYAFYALPATAPGDYGAFGILGGTKGSSGTDVNDDTPAELPIEEHKTRVSSIAFQDGNFSWQNTDLTLGSQSEPYGLSFKRFYHASGASSDGPLGRGWTHNLNMSVSVYSDIMQGLAETSVLAGAAAIVEMYVCVNLLSDLTRPHDKFVIASLANAWLNDQLVDNVVSVNSPNVNAQFIKLPSGSYVLPPKSQGSLIKNGNGTYTFKTLDQIAYNFNSSGQIATIVYPFGVTWTFTYSSGKLTSVTTGMGRTLTLNYTGNRLTSVTDGTGRSISFSVNGSGNLTQFTDPDSKNTVYAYDSSNRMTQIFYPAFPSNAYLTNVYDSIGQVKEQQDAYGNTTQYFYAGYRTEVVNAAGKKFITYLNRFGDLVKSIDHLGKVTTTEYDAIGRVIKIVEPELNSKEFTYNIDNQQLTVTRKPKSGGGSIVNSYTYHTTFKNKVATAIDGRGLQTTLNYHASTGLLLTVQQPQVGGQTPTTSMTYNSRGQIETVTDPTGIVSKSTYDTSTERMLSVIHDFGTSPRLNLTTSYGHNSRGDITSVTNPRGYTTSYQFDTKRRVTQVTTPSPFSFVTKMTFDANDNLTKIERQTNIIATPWQTFERTYAFDNKVLTQKSPTNDVTTFEYNNLRQLKKVTDPMLRVVEYSYDDLGRHYTTKDATGTVALTQTYTDNGLPLTTTDKRGNDTTISYDEYDRTKRITDADTLHMEFVSYDSNHNPLQIRTRDAQLIDFTFDNLNRLSTRTASPTVSYTYDLAGRPLTASRPIVSGDPGSGTFTNFYDSAGRFYKEQYPDNKSVIHELDPNGNVTKTTYPDGWFVQNSFDELDRMTAIKLNGATSSAIAFAWDALSRKTSQSYENGASVSFEYALDNAVTDIDHTFVGSSVNFDYGYNANNEPLAQQVSDPAYMWSPLTSGTTTYGTASSINTYPTIGGQTQAYTNLGAVSNDGQRSLSYNDLNQVTQVSKGAATVGFTYDPNDRQVEKAVGATKTQYYYGGAMQLADYSGGVSQERYVYGPGGDIAMRVSASSGSKTFYHTDRDGSVIALSNSSGAVTDKYAYSPYGESANLSGTTHGFLGQRYDNETGLYSSTTGESLASDRGRLITATTGGSVGFGNVSGGNPQQTTPPPQSNPALAGQFPGIGGLSAAGPDPWNPMFSHAPRVPQTSEGPNATSGYAIEIPKNSDPTKGGGFGAALAVLAPLIRKVLIRQIMLESAKAAGAGAAAGAAAVAAARLGLDRAVDALRAELRKQFGYPNIPPGGLPGGSAASGAGTSFHKSAGDALQNWANNAGLDKVIGIEAKYGGVGPYNKGGVQLDFVIRLPNGQPVVVLDWKTGGADLTPGRVQYIRDAIARDGFDPDIPILPL